MAPQPPSPVASGNDRHASQSWPPQNDRLLMDARQRGMNWQPIATKYFPDKTANACRKRHERLMEKRSANENWEGVKMETLARAYVDVREQMWKILADRVGERWQIVEQKCMEKGLKTLQTAGRTATRRERANLGNDLDPHNSDIPDSRYATPQQSGSHQEGDEPSFNDSGLGRSGNHPFTTNSRHDDQPYTLPSATPSYSSSVRSYSTPTSTGYTPTIPNAPQFGSPMMAQSQSLPPLQPPQPTLPSFSSAFGMPSISTVMSSHSPQRGAAVTTHC
ncbi:hypothetical protein N7G274_005861 [Stereocaulon virgatum]|uniref:Myb-like domain-containing protein n=1 Tax=Stereocaulon virgatum TaxID=373712 RepID=A0ABR4A9R7_9LECA